MTEVIIEEIQNLEDLLMFSKAYKKGLIRLNVSKLARHLQKDRKTIRRYLNGDVPKTTRTRTKYLDEYRDYIVEVLSDKYQSFDYIDHLFKYLKREKQITCSRSTFNRYIRKDEELNQLFKRKKTNSFTERFETDPGYQAQFDIKEKVKLINKTGEQITTYIPTLTLSWSRYNCRSLTLDTKVETLLSFYFYEEATNIVFIGNPGVGKTHLAVAIGYSVAIRRNSVYFIKFNKLISILKNAYQEGTIDKRLRHFFKYRLLIIDEVGFNEVSPLESKLFFQLIDLRYTKKSTIFTSNTTFDKWPQILGNDEMITKAIIDRILHHSYLFNITGPSYRIKDKLKLNKTEES